MVLVAIAVALASVGGAQAHGDPASHYLEGESLYPGFANRPSQEVELRLLGLLQAASAAGYPVKVALVGNVNDLTDNPAMLRRPQRYADFVASALGGGRAPVVIVSPYGIGVAGARRQLVRTVAVSQRANGDALARAAMAAVRQLARAAGHALPERVRPAGPIASDPAGHGAAIDLRLLAVPFALVLPLTIVLYEVWLPTRKEALNLRNPST